MLLRHAPHAHHDLAVLLSFIFGQALQPEYVIWSHDRRRLATSRLLGLRLGLCIAHCCDRERTSAQTKAEAWGIENGKFVAQR